MHRPLLMGALLVLASALGVAGYYQWEGRGPFAREEGDAGETSLFSRRADGRGTTSFRREPNGPGKPLKQRSHFQARGRDQDGNRWEGYLVVERAPEGYLRAGYFEWSRGEDGGRYHFEGTFDPQTRTVRWSGVTIEDQFGVPARAIYTATLSTDGRRFEKGRWSGGQSVPGEWTAEHVGDW